MNVISEGAALAMVVAGVVGLVLAVVVAGAMLMVALRVVEKFTPGFGRSCGTAIAGYAIGAAAQFALVRALYDLAIRTGLVPGPGLLGATATSLAAAIALVLWTFASSIAIKGMIARPDGSALPYGRALRVAAVYILMLAATFAVVVAALLLLVGGVPGVSR